MTFNLKEVNKFGNNSDRIRYKFNLRQCGEYKDLTKMVRWLVFIRRLSEKVLYLARTIEQLLQKDFSTFSKEDAEMLFHQFCKLSNQSLQPTAKDCKQLYEKLQSLHDIDFGFRSDLDHGTSNISKVYQSFFSEASTGRRRATQSSYDVDELLSLFLAMILSRLAELRQDVSAGFEELRQELQGGTNSNKDQTEEQNQNSEANNAKIKVCTIDQDILQSNNDIKGKSKLSQKIGGNTDNSSYVTMPAEVFYSRAGTLMIVRESSTK